MIRSSSPCLRRTGLYCTVPGRGAALSFPTTTLDEPPLLRIVSIQGPAVVGHAFPSLSASSRPSQHLDLHIQLSSVAPCFNCSFHLFLPLSSRAPSSTFPLVVRLSLLLLCCPPSDARCLHLDQTSLSTPPSLSLSLFLYLSLNLLHQLSPYQSAPLVAFFSLAIRACARFLFTQQPVIVCYGRNLRCPLFILSPCYFNSSFQTPPFWSRMLSLTAIMSPNIRLFFLPKASSFRQPP